MKRICWLIVLCLGLLITHAIAKPGSNKPTTPPATIDFRELDKLVPAELKEKNTPGTVITVISGDQVIYPKAFGVANVETNAEMQPEMLFRLGSTTKMFTAAALLTLAENNKIKMNEPIGNRVTPHHLLSNSAGIRDFTAPVISNGDPSLGNMIRSWKDNVFFADQGEIYSYSSPGYWLSGFVVEELQGKPFGAENENEVVFVQGNDGKIRFLFTELYGAKKIR